jgi:hypothetical protein
LCGDLEHQPCLEHPVVDQVRVGPGDEHGAHPVDVGRHQPHQPRHGPSKQRRADCHGKDDRAYAERISDELPEREEQPLAGQRGADDDQKDRERAAQRADRVGDAKQERIPQALLPVDGHPAAAQDAERPAGHQDPHAQPGHAGAEDDSDVRKDRDQPAPTGCNYDAHGGKDQDGTGGHDGGDEQGPERPARGRGTRSLGSQLEEVIVGQQKVTATGTPPMVSLTISCHIRIWTG